jgi:hypothetical protein
MSQSSSSRRYKYTKVLDNRKFPIRGLRRLNGNFKARITVEDEAGRKSVRWVSLEAGKVAGAQEEFRELIVECTANQSLCLARCAFVCYRHLAYAISGNPRKGPQLSLHNVR